MHSPAPLPQVLRPRACLDAVVSPVAGAGDDRRKKGCGRTMTRGLVDDGRIPHLGESRSLQNGVGSCSRLAQNWLGLDARSHA